MAGNSGAGDEESQSSTKVQSFSSTPRKLDQEEIKHMPILAGRLGLEDLFSLRVWRASIAEVLGTAVLVFAIDTIVISSIETKTDMPNVLMSTLIGIVVAILLLVTFPVSGGNINPIITFSAALVGLMSYSRAFVYILAQCVGGVLGALALKAVVGSSIESTFSLGGCTLNVIAPGPDGPIEIGIDTGPALWLEIICTFIFLFASIWLAFDERQAKPRGPVTVFTVVGIVVGLMVFISTTVTTKKGYAGVGMNPARCLGPAIVRGGPLWDRHWVFWVGPIISCFAFYLYVILIPRQHITDK